MAFKVHYFISAKADEIRAVDIRADSMKADEISADEIRAVDSQSTASRPLLTRNYDVRQRASRPFGNSAVAGYACIIQTHLPDRMYVREPASRCF